MRRPFAEDSYTCYTETNNTSANVDITNNNKTWFYCAFERGLKRYVRACGLPSLRRSTNVLVYDKYLWLISLQKAIICKRPAVVLERVQKGHRGLKK